MLIPGEISSEIIELLRPATVIRKMGPTVVPMNRGTLTIPRMAGGSTADYIGESTDIPISQPEFGQLKFFARTLATLCPISNDLLNFADSGTDQLIVGDLVNGMSQREDRAFLRDVGAGNAPKGLRYWAPAANLIPANGTVNLANITHDLGKLELALMSANCRMLRLGWIMSPRTYVYLLDLRDGNGNKAFPELEQMRLRNKPVGISNQIPENLGGAGNESELYLADFADVVIAESSTLAIDTSKEAAYMDGSTMVSTFSRNETVVRVIAQHDFGVRHASSVAVLTEVDWGA